MKPWDTTHMNTHIWVTSFSALSVIRYKMGTCPLWTCWVISILYIYMFYYVALLLDTALYRGLTSALPQAFPSNESLFCYFISQILGKNDHQAQHKTRRLEGTAVLVFLVQRRMKKVKKSKQKPSFSSSYSRIACCLAAAVSITPFSHYFI